MLDLNISMLPSAREQKVLTVLDYNEVVDIETMSTLTGISTSTLVQIAFNLADRKKLCLYRGTDLGKSPLTESCPWSDGFLPSVDAFRFAKFPCPTGNITTHDTPAHDNAFFSNYNPKRPVGAEFSIMPPT